MSEETPKKEKKSVGVPVATRVMVLLLVVALGAAAFFFVKYQDASSDTPEAIAARNAEESAEVIAALGGVLLLNEEADPTVAKVDDAETLKEANPDFYADTVNGDYLVLYPTRAIIFRLEDKQIINVAPIINTSNIDAGTGGDAADDAATDEVAE